jgi:NitT/TauT family transport system substrate-binding protein
VGKKNAVLLMAGLATSALTGCSVASGANGADGVETVVVGYQSRTINTVTAGTLLKEQGYFEKQLEELGKENGKTYEVEWQDYDTGAPITAQMLAGKIDIGSMGDYPLLINGSTAGKSESTATELVSITGYNPKGALNGVVVGKDSGVTSFKQLEGKKISASVGSAGHGTLVQALTEAGIDPVEDVSVENQQPSIGASALQSGSVDALSQFVAWPGYLVFRDDDRLVYDGGQLDVPTFHGVVVRKEFASGDRDVLDAFLRSQIEATDYLHEHPVEAAEKVGEAAELPAEVVYLYNGRNGVATFDTTIKPDLVDALGHDAPFLKSIGVLTDPLDIEGFVDDEYLKDVLPSYDKDVTSTSNPAAITGRDEVCDRQVRDEKTAGEVWVDGEQEPRPVADPECLLRTVAQVEADGDHIRAVYIPDALTGTRWFADQSVWLELDGSYLPFATRDNADEYADDHPGAKPVAYADAVEAVAR